MLQKKPTQNILTILLMRKIRPFNDPVSSLHSHFNFLVAATSNCIKVRFAFYHKIAKKILSNRNLLFVLNCKWNLQVKHVDTTAEVFSVAAGASSAILVSPNLSLSETEIALSSLFLLAVGDLAGWQGVKVCSNFLFWKCAPAQVCSNFHYHWTDNFCVLQVWRLSDAHLVQQVINLIWILNAVQFFWQQLFLIYFKTFPAMSSVIGQIRLISVEGHSRRSHPTGPRCFCCWQSITLTNQDQMPGFRKEESI